MEHLDLLNTSHGENVAISIAKFTFRSLHFLRFPDETYWSREKVDTILDSCSDLECISITKRMFTVNQMQALLYRKKWRNIKKIVLHAGYEDTISNEDYILRLVENIDLVTSSHRGVHVR